MAIQQIQTTVGAEQEVIVPYGDLTIKITLQFDDYNTQWFCNLTNQDTDEAIVNGIYLKLGYNALFGLGLNLGSLGLIDTDPTNTTAIDLKADLGNRIQLVRDLDA